MKTTEEICDIEKCIKRLLEIIQTECVSLESNIANVSVYYDHTTEEVVFKWVDVNYNEWERKINCNMNSVAATVNQVWTWFYNTLILGKNDDSTT